MITYRRGDILEADVEALVNTVNCVGVMGRGIALQFKNAYPSNFKAYAAACKRHEVLPGRMFVFETGRLTNPRYVINFPTKRHWRGKSRMEDVDSGLRALVDVVRDRGIRSIAIPPLGSGLGGLAWSDVRPRIEAAFADLGAVDVVVFEPDGRPAEAKGVKSRDVPAMTPGRAALVALMDRYLAGLMDPEISLLEVHKLLYFLQVAGEPLNLRFKEAPYGPYAERLRHVLRAIEGHMVHGYFDGGDDPGKPLALVPGAVEEARAFLAGNAETQARIDRVSELVEGFESPFGLELLSTVHWVVRDQPSQAAPEVVEKVHAWGARKRTFSHAQIELARTILTDQRWFDDTESSDGTPTA